MTVYISGSLLNLKTSLFAGMTLTLHTSQVYCSGVMPSSVCVRSFPGESSLRSLRADCFAVGLYCVTITWQ